MTLPERASPGGRLPESAPPSERPFLVGPDIVTEEAVLLPAATTAGRATITKVLVTIHPGDVPGLSHLANGSGLGVNGRSRLAIFGAAPATPDASFMDDSAINALKEGKEVHIPIPLANFAARPIRVPKGIGIGQLFRFGGTRLEGEALEVAIRQGRIVIDGSWYWVDGDPSLGKKIAIQVPLDLNPDKICWLPPSDEPIEVPTGSYADFRRILGTILKPISEVRPTQRFLAIRWTKDAIRIPDARTIALLSSIAVGHPDHGDPPNAFAPQINSRIIHGGGKTDHTIITEQLMDPPNGDGARKRVPNSVALSFRDMG